MTQSASKSSSEKQESAVSCILIFLSQPRDVLQGQTMGL